MRLLALDSAGSASSAAIWQDGVVLAQARRGGAHHGEALLELVEQCLSASGLALARMEAIACGRGPGAFTGVRLTLSVAQGLAFAAGCGVIPVSNLQAAAARAARLDGASPRLLVCHDARMQEVYWAAYESGAAGIHRVGVEAVAAPAAVALPAAWAGGAAPWGVGTGFDAYAAAFAPLRRQLAHCVPLEGEAEDIARMAVALGLAHAVEPEQAAPIYLRDDVAQESAAKPRGPVA